LDWGQEFGGRIYAVMHLQITRQAGNLPGGMWQTGHTDGQCGSGKQKVAACAERNKRLEC